MSEFLKINNLKVEYTSGGAVIKAVNDVSFSMEKGETLGLVGETGAGKTTIAKAILSILPDPPAKVKNGEILMDGADILKMSEKELLNIRGNRISMIFQDPMTALNPIMSVGSQITEVILLHNKIPEKKAVERSCQMLEMVGIPRERYVEYPHQFSGGMRQRVVIAMALACEPDLLLADEPTTALDVTIQAQVLEMIANLQKERQTTLILITHDLGIVAETCDKVAIVYAGYIVESGSKYDIFVNPAHPYTNGLFGSIPNLNSKSKWLNPVPGLPPDPADLPNGCPFAPRCPMATDICLESNPEIRELTPGHNIRCHNAELKEVK